MKTSGSLSLSAVFTLIAFLTACPAVCFGADAPSSNTVPWNDDFDSQYTNLTPLVYGTNGWYSTFSGTNSECAIVQEDVKYSDPQAAMVPIDVTLSNRFSNTTMRAVGMEMDIQPQLYDGTNPLFPAVATDVAAQFYVDSNGYFVVCNGTNWRTITTMADGRDALPITNSYFTKVQINLRYKNHTWNLKAWSNTTLMASTYYINFTSNMNTFNGFDIYNGNFAMYVDDVSVDVGGRQSMINGVPFDTIKSINGAHSAAINGVTE